MTNKEIADRLRSICDESTPLLHETLTSLADELDPPRPEPGTVVRWRGKSQPFVPKDEWCIGIVDAVRQHVIAKDGIRYPLANLEWKPARIATPTQAIVDVPPVSEWPEWAVYLEGKFHNGESQQWCDALFITRAEAEKMEAEG